MAERYQLVLRHPDGREEHGAFRRSRPDGPRLGHALTTIEHGSPVVWQVVEERAGQDANGEPYLELVAERDYAEVEETPNHQLEHALDREQEPPDVLVRAAASGEQVELVALDPGEAPDWDEAHRYLDALVIEEINDDLLVHAGVNPDSDPRERWIETVKDRLRADLEAFRADVDGAHDEIEEWDYGGGRIFASVGTFDDEANPNAGHGWLTRLYDAGVLEAAGFVRVHRTQLE
jgi:hypothetical protein